MEGRDAIWAHPDLLPTDEDLKDPQGFTPRRQLAEASMDDIDAALSKLLDGGFDEPAAGTPGRESTGDESTGNGDAPGSGDTGGTGTGPDSGPTDK